MHAIINTKTNRHCYVTRDEEGFSGDWKERYPHLNGCKYQDIDTPSLRHCEIAGRIPFTYDLCSDGGYFHLWVDTGLFDDGDIERAKQNLYRERDVVGLSVHKVTHAPMFPLVRSQIAGLSVADIGDRLRALEQSIQKRQQIQEIDLNREHFESFLLLSRDCTIWDCLRACYDEAKGQR